MKHLLKLGKNIGAMSIISLIRFLARGWNGKVCFEPSNILRECVKIGLRMIRFHWKVQLRCDIVSYKSPISNNQLVNAATLSFCCSRKWLSVRVIIFIGQILNKKHYYATQKRLSHSAFSATDVKSHRCL